MTKRKLPDTSHAAHKAATHEMREDHHKKIITALQSLGIANYEMIAAFCKMERHAIGRRLSELERSMVVYKPGSKTPTKSGRMAYDYCLTEQHTLKVEHPATVLIDKTKEIQEWFSKYQDGEFDEKLTNNQVPPSQLLINF